MALSLPHKKGTLLGAFATILETGFSNQRFEMFSPRRWRASSPSALAQQHTLALLPSGKAVSQMALSPPHKKGTLLGAFVCVITHSLIQ